MGRFKAAFFRSLGFESNDLEALQRALGALLLNEAKSETPTRYGIKYEVRGTLVGPGGQIGRVVSV